MLASQIQVKNIDLKDIDDSKKLATSEDDAAFCIYMLAKNNETGALEPLMRLAKDVNHYFGNGETALHRAVLSGSDKVVSVLIQDKKKCDIDLPDKNGKTALDIAKENKNNVIEKLLIEAKAASKIFPRAEIFISIHLLQNRLTNFFQPRSAESLVCLLAANNDYKTLIEMSEHVQHFNAQYFIGRSALHLVAEGGSPEALHELLHPKNKKKININLKDDFGWTALHIAIVSKQKEIVSQLVFQAKADVLATNEDGMAPIHIAALKKDPELIGLLLASTECDLEQVNDKEFKRTAAHYAAQSNNVEVVKKLLPVADFKKEDDQGLTPLHLAVFYGANESVHAMLQYPDKIAIDAPINASKNFPATAAYMAAEKGRETVLHDLHKAKADLVLQNPQNGKAPLHLAASNGKYKCVKFLIKHYSNTLIEDERKHSPFYYACHNKNWKTARLILKASQKKKLSFNEEDQALQNKFSIQLNRSSKSAVSKSGMFSKRDALPSTVSSVPKRLEK